MSTLKQHSAGQVKRSRRSFGVAAMLLLAIFFTHTLIGSVAAQVATPTAVTTPIATTAPGEALPTPTSQPTTESSKTATAASLVDNQLADQIKARVRARILALIRARMTLSATKETFLLPMVMGGAMLTSTATITDTPAAAPVTGEAVTVPDATATPVAEVATAAPTATPLVEVVPVTPTATAPPVAAAPPPAETAAGAARTAQVPILMYHYLSEPPPDADIYRRDLSVTPSRFAEHLDRLLAEGYTTIRLNDLLLHLTQGTPLPPKPVILTFDDGYRDNYVNAFPLLRERGMTATFFIVTDFIDEQRPEYLSWDMVREMYAGGMAIESHGRNHASLASRDDDYLIWQALGSLETIQYELGVRPHFISYPAGDYDENTIRIFQSANYWAGVTTKQGATHNADDLFQLRRVRVRGTTSAEDLVQLLAIDW